MKKKIFLLIIFSLELFAGTSPVTLKERTGWTFSNNNSIQAIEPSKLKYFKFYDNLPDEISLQAFKDKDLTGFENKHIVVGYGLAEASGKNCKIFPPAVTGKQNPITICLPWWRIERTYQKTWKNVNDLKSFFKTLSKPKPPINVSYCKDWEKGAVYPGGIVTCTQYYDKLISSDCYSNPKQGKCFVDNCGNYLEDKCDFQGLSLGETTTEQWAKPEGGLKIGQAVSRIDLKTKQYKCPAGQIIPHTVCKDETSALMYPYTCEKDDPNTVRDDGVYMYCDKNKPSYDANGDIVGFLGNCPNGKEVICNINKIDEEKKVCKEPIKETSIEKTTQSTFASRNYVEKTVDVISGEPDIYASDPNCLRANTIEEARKGIFQARIVGNGKLDDDIFVLSHSNSGKLTKIYCNQQHNGAKPEKLVDGTTIKCIANNGTYKFDKTVKINAADIVSVQQATERDYAGSSVEGTRTHYYSTELTIDQVLVAPETGPDQFPGYLKGRFPSYLPTWENSLATLSIMFPFSGAYKLYFYDANNELMASSTVNGDDFKDMGTTGNLRLTLGESMKLLSGKNKCLTDNFLEWGGGTANGKDSITGDTCVKSDDSYALKHPVTKIIIKDLLTGSITKVPLVYPLPYPNRVFISKLKLREKRKYRCYKPFPVSEPKN